ncbi:ribosomal-protein-alanine N-acetyltransferase [Methyloligella halotolerans]|uniref:Ribosomal-protein-alanine N-acetyltransferase n=1 Tax=Methyloligella halotolerans TaxID=1177755 RepID=A0A1E2S072_9HYPH|nr:ribosomal protein S18-alanine N-acetyltransferase [Methyloligella halotolerans]ODA67874.1 ribosomal-protein-alanine N-acetyltransferase [Methyloligella halotolerans]
MEGPRIAARQAAVKDAEALAAVHAACFSAPWDAELLKIFLEARDSLCVLSTEGETVTGFLLTRIAADEAEILTLAVAPETRRQGIARTLLEAAVDGLKQRGAKHLFLEVDEKNVAALGLYRGLGAKPVGRRPAYYADGGDAAILRLTLDERLAEDGPTR